MELATNISNKPTATSKKPTRFHSGTAHKASQWHSAQDFSVAQPTRLHSGTAHKASQWHSAQDFTVEQRTRVHSGTAHKTSQWQWAQEHNGRLKTYGLRMKRQSYKQLNFKHSLDKMKSKYGIHIRIQLRIFEKLLRNR